MTCIWPGCSEETTYTWLCCRHTLEKEFRYAEYDLKHAPAFVSANKDRTLERVLAWVEQNQDQSRISG